MIPEKLPEGWFESDSEQASSFHSELQKELPEGHILYNCPVKVVGHRTGTDDILCQHEGDTGRYTVIHISWSMKTEIDSVHPTVEVDGSFSDFLEYEKKWYKD